VHGLLRWPTIVTDAAQRDHLAPTLAERVSVHLLVYAIWAIGFGMTVWRGVPSGMIDVRLGFERGWPVIEFAEWIYLSVYFVPISMPWLATQRWALRRYAIHLWWLLGASLVCFWLLPFGSPPRTFEPTSLAGEILAWETGRADFAAASLPSFHVFWGLLCANLLETRSRLAGVLGWLWAIAVAGSCVATGAHAMADIAASVVIYVAVVALVRTDERRPEARPIRNPTRRPATSAPVPK
jgi:hypothetical protein